MFDCFIKREYLFKHIENVEYENPSKYLPIEEMYFGANVKIFIAIKCNR